MTVEEIVNIALEAKIKNITLTGGEPLIHSDVKNLIDSLLKHNFEVEIETNGSVSIVPFLDLKGISFTLDYKCPSSLEEDKMNLDNYNYLTKGDCVKFVVGDLNDLKKALYIIEKYNLILKTNCLISPVFGKIEPKQIVEFLISNNLNEVRMQLQIHKFIWDPNLRGV